jgi:16S rRNA (uracil1498-N3)-methyltransferase
MHAFYIPTLLPTIKQLFLSEEESKHACRVMRLTIGDLIELLDGKGGRYEAKIISDHPKKCEVEVVGYTKEVKQPFDIHIAISPTKNMDRIEWFIEKATELGLTKISFIQTERSERKLMKTDRIEKIAIAAMKQSHRTYLPLIEELKPFKTFVQQYPTGGIAHCEEFSSQNILTVAIATNFPILIGPEGDFTANEVELALKSGYRQINLGKTRLRTETAGIYAVTLLKSKFE